MNETQAYRRYATQDVSPMPGAFVISLDFELHWGVFDRTPLNRAEKDRLLAARAVVPRILELFQEFSIHATWAVVGMLFARSRKEAERFRPRLHPSYSDPRRNPYDQQLGDGEADDPYHFAPSLIDMIASTDGQEIASHSFSHYCSLERGQTTAEFEDDLHSAVSIAEASGHRLQSYVFPRNEINPAYLPILANCGFRTYRDTESAGIKRSAPFVTQRQLHKRAGRLLDSYVNLLGDETADWPVGEALAAIPASRYLRPYRTPVGYLQPLLIERIRSQMLSACKLGRLFHLWCHPEDFAFNSDQDMKTLRQILEYFAELRSRCGMISSAMSEVMDCSVSQSKELAYNAL